jgi:hypothetical protein
MSAPVPSRVLVACASAWDAPARLPRLLSDAGCHVTVTCPEGAGGALSRTRFAHAFAPAPPGASPAEAVTALRHHLRDHRYDWVVAADDPLLEALADLGADDLGWAASWLPVDVGRVSPRVLASKAEFVKVAAAAGLPVPASAVVTSAEGVLRASASVGFPLVVKRACSYAGMGVRLAATAADLEDACDELCDGPSPELIVQSFVTGRLGNTMALFQRGVPVAWLSAFKARTFPGAFGPSAARQLADPPEAHGILHALGAHLGYHGFCAVDWIEDERTGRLQILELNARPVPALHLGAGDGVDFARAVRSLLLGAPQDAQRARSLRDEEPVTPLFPQDFYRAVTEGDSAALEAWRRGTQPFADVPWDDPPLLAYYLRRRLIRRRFDETFPRAAGRSARA